MDFNDVTNNPHESSLAILIAFLNLLRYVYQTPRATVVTIRDYPHYCNSAHYVGRSLDITKFRIITLCFEYYGAK
jgi:hypothetical protein